MGNQASKVKSKSTAHLLCLRIALLLEGVACPQSLEPQSGLYSTIRNHLNYAFKTRPTVHRYTIYVQTYMYIITQYSVWNLQDKVGSPIHIQQGREGLQTESMFKYLFDIIGCLFLCHDTVADRHSPDPGNARRRRLKRVGQRLL